MGTLALLSLVLLTATRWFLLVGKGTALAYFAVLASLPPFALFLALSELRDLLQTVEFCEATYGRTAADGCYADSWRPTPGDPLHAPPARRIARWQAVHHLARAQAGGRGDGQSGAASQPAKKSPRLVFLLSLTARICLTTSDLTSQAARTPRNAQALPAYRRPHAQPCLSPRSSRGSLLGSLHAPAGPQAPQEPPRLPIHFVLASWACPNAGRLGL